MHGHDLSPVAFAESVAKDAGVRLLADMIMNDRNRMMYMTYKFNHFSEIGQSSLKSCESPPRVRTIS